MPPASPLIDAALRRHVCPALKAAGFTVSGARRAWRWLPDSTWVVTIRAVGGYFSSVTGWPPSSASVWLGVHYPFIPGAASLKHDRVGRPLPAEYQCHMRSHLTRTLSQRERLVGLHSTGEQERTDLWWFDPDGRNSDQVAFAMAVGLKGVTAGWFQRCSDLALTLEDVAQERDCFNKFVLATYLARQIGSSGRYTHYRTLAEETGRLIEKTPDPVHWFPLYSR